MTTHQTGVFNCEWDMMGRQYIVRISEELMPEFIEKVKAAYESPELSVEFQLFEEQWVPTPIEKHFERRSRMVESG
jgi:hypothetical protein